MTELKLEECECLNKEKDEFRSYELMDYNCRVIHDPTDKWHYIVITCGGKEFTEYAKKTLLENQHVINMVNRIKKRHGIGCDCGFCECLRIEDLRQ